MTVFFSPWGNATGPFALRFCGPLFGDTPRVRASYPLVQDPKFASSSDGTSHCLVVVVVVCDLVSPRDRCHHQTPLLLGVIVSKSQE